MLALLPVAARQCPPPKALLSQLLQGHPQLRAEAHSLEQLVIALNAVGHVVASKKTVPHLSA